MQKSCRRHPEREAVSGRMCAECMAEARRRYRENQARALQWGRNVEVTDESSAQARLAAAAKSQ